MRKQSTILPTHHSLPALFAAIGAALVFAALLFALLAAPTARAQASVIYVEDDSACVAACGGSWATAYPHLQDALAAATPGSEIWVASGIYYPDQGTGQTDNDRTSTFNLLNGASLYGGFAGNETLRSERDWEANVTVLSGDIDGNDLTGPDGIPDDTSGIQGANAYHVVTASGTDSSAVLDGFTVTAGAAEGGFPQNGGGGMFNLEGSATLANLVFHSNFASSIGGGIANVMGALDLINVRFSSNEAESGGAMFNTGWPILSGQGAAQTNTILNVMGAPSLNNVVFLDNHAIYGGGMLNDLISPTLTSATFISNTADWGGGLYNFESNSQLSDATFEGNEAFFEGGGVLNDFSSPTLQNVTFSNNFAEAGGGMSNFDVIGSVSSAAAPDSNERYQSAGRLRQESASFHSVSLLGTSPQLTHATFISNAATVGGGIYSLQSTPVLSDVTFSHNLAFEAGGGIYMENVLEGSIGESGEPSKDAQSAMHTPSLTNVTFYSNTVEGFGGGMFSLNISPTLTSVSFLENFGLLGGGLAALGGNLVVEDVTFTDNMAAIGGALLIGDEELAVSFPGEALEAAGSAEWDLLENLPYEAIAAGSLQLSRATFINNVASLGGGLASLGGAPQINGAHFENNSAQVGGAMVDFYGGSLVGGNEGGESPVTEANGDSATSLTNVTFISNTTVISEDTETGVAGALLHIGSENLETTEASFNGEATIEMLNVSFLGNSASVAGAVMFDSATPALVNVEFSGNYAVVGGALLNSSSNPILTNVTFAANFATDTGGTMINQGSYPIIQNSIFWGNQDSNGSGASIINSRSVPTFTHSLVQGSGGSASWDSSLGNDGGGNIDADPLFVRQPDPGDGDWTTHDDNDYGDLQLQAGSPAIDAGNNSADLDGDGSGTMTIADIPEDLAGNPRLVFGTVDMGAYEFQTAELGLSKSVSTATALPGQPITYTLNFSNTGFALASGVVISDPLPVELTDINIQSTIPITPIGSIDYAWQLPDLAPGDEGTITINGVVSPALSADTVFTNTATISTPQPEQNLKDNISTVPVTILVPRVSFSNSSYTVSEGAGTAVIDVTLDAPNPYAPVQVAYSTTPGTATPDDDYTTASGVLTIPAGSGSESFNVPVFEDNQTEPAETVQLTLNGPTGAALADPTEATLTIIDGPALVFLPLIVHDEPVGLPDLVITDISVTEDGLEVVVANVGEGPATSGFWVDAYVNPERPPQRVNDVWWRVGDEGLVWGVAGNALPLDPGESLTLTYGDTYYVPAESGFSGTIEAGAQLYAQADSANTDDPFGGIVETHEASGGPYNNILGPVTAGATLQAPAVENNGLLPDELPAR